MTQWGQAPLCRFFCFLRGGMRQLCQRSPGSVTKHPPVSQQLRAKNTKFLGINHGSVTKHPPVSQQLRAKNTKFLGINHNPS